MQDLKFYQGLDHNLISKNQGADYKAACLIEPYIFCKFQTWKSKLAAEELDMGLIMNVFNTLPILTW